jgi:hypothetical protein
MALGWAAFRNARRRTVRAPVNPMDKCTLVSVYPKTIHEKKISLQPGEFIIEPGTYDKPSTLIIGPSSWWRDVGEDEPLLEITHSSTVMADSIVKDYMNGLIGCNMVDSMPGLFWLPGEILDNELMPKYKPQLDKARKNQTNYYQIVVKLADSLWARTNGNPLAIPGIAKLAAHELQLNREWLQQFVAPEIIKCVACGSMRNPAYPVCPTCKAVVDVEMAKKLNLKFAE